jgi:hypothetical protein
MKKLLLSLLLLTSFVKTSDVNPLLPSETPAPQKSAQEIVVTDFIKIEPDLLQINEFLGKIGRFEDTYLFRNLFTENPKLLIDVAAKLKGSPADYLKLMKSLNNLSGQLYITPLEALLVQQAYVNRYDVVIKNDEFKSYLLKPNGGVKSVYEYDDVTGVEGGVIFFKLLLEISTPETIDKNFAALTTVFTGLQSFDIEQRTKSGLETSQTIDSYTANKMFNQNFEITDDSSEEAKDLFAQKTAAVEEWLKTDNYNYASHLGSLKLMLYCKRKAILSDDQIASILDKINYKELLKSAPDKLLLIRLMLEFRNSTDGIIKILNELAPDVLTRILASKSFESDFREESVFQSLELFKDDISDASSPKRIYDKFVQTLDTITALNVEQKTLIKNTLMIAVIQSKKPNGQLSAKDVIKVLEQLPQNTKLVKFKEVLPSIVDRIIKAILPKSLITWWNEKYPDKEIVTEERIVPELPPEKPIVEQPIGDDPARVLGEGEGA